MKTARIVLIMAGLALAGAASARADYPYPYAWPNQLGPTAYGVSGTMYGLGIVPVPPYYALHPPVYYSCPVPRSYGYSPYAYPGCVQTPEVDFRALENGEEVEPAAPGNEELPAQQTSKVARGEWIANPFVLNPSHGMIANQFVSQDDESPLAVVE
jgi:hypothetical protein